MQWFGQAFFFFLSCSNPSLSSANRTLTPLEGIYIPPFGQMRCTCWSRLPIAERGGHRPKLDLSDSPLLGLCFVGGVIQAPKCCWIRPVPFSSNRFLLCTSTAAQLLPSAGPALHICLDSKNCFLYFHNIPHQLERFWVEMIGLSERLERIGIFCYDF